MRNHASVFAVLLAALPFAALAQVAPPPSTAEAPIPGIPLTEPVPPRPLRFIVVQSADVQLLMAAAAKVPIAFEQARQAAALTERLQGAMAPIDAARAIDIEKKLQPILEMMPPNPPKPVAPPDPAPAAAPASSAPTASPATVVTGKGAASAPAPTTP